MGEYGNCSVCKGKLVLYETKIIGGTTYNMLRCEKCKKQVARTAN